MPTLTQPPFCELHLKYHPIFRELDESGEANELPPMEHREVDGEIQSAAVLPGATGFVYYFERNQSQSEPWSAYLFDQQANEYIPLYTGSRQIQSVGGSVDGNVIILSMRETIDTTSDYEIYRGCKELALP
jgi:hypothetical protein